MRRNALDDPKRCHGDARCEILLKTENLRKSEFRRQFNYVETQRNEALQVSNIPETINHVWDVRSGAKLRWCSTWALTFDYLPRKQKVGPLETGKALGIDFNCFPVTFSLSSPLSAPQLTRLTSLNGFLSSPLREQSFSPLISRRSKASALLLSSERLHYDSSSAWNWSLFPISAREATDEAFNLHLLPSPLPRSAPAPDLPLLNTVDGSRYLSLRFDFADCRGLWWSAERTLDFFFFFCSTREKLFNDSEIYIPLVALFSAIFYRITVPARKAKRNGIQMNEQSGERKTLPRHKGKVFHFDLALRGVLARQGKAEVVGGGAKLDAGRWQSEKKRSWILVGCEDCFDETEEDTKDVLTWANGI